MQEFFKNIASAAWFQTFIIIVIVLAGVLVGLETYPSVVERHHVVLHLADQIILWIFVAEIVIKMAAEGNKPWRYFLDPWNVSDFIIVAACFLPFEGNAVTVLRLLRLLRVLKLVKALPKLQILVGALLKSIPSMVYVSVLLFLLFYVYAVAAVFLFGENDPLHFRNLEYAMLSLFRVVTLEDWTDLMYINMFGCDRYGYDADSVVLCTAPKAQPIASALYFVTFVLSGTMIILNLFIGVIMSGMAEAQAEAQEMTSGDTPSAAGEVQALQHELAALQTRLGSLARLIDRQQ